MFRRRDSSVAIRSLALMTAVVGVLDLIAAIMPSLPDTLEDLAGIYPLEVRSGAHVFAAFSSFLLISLAANLLRRKKAGLDFGVGLACLLNSSSFISGYK